jgi:hypothetical protein
MAEPQHGEATMPQALLHDGRRLRPCDGGFVSGRRDCVQRREEGRGGRLAGDLLAGSAVGRGRIGLGRKIETVWTIVCIICLPASTRQ